MLKDIIYSTFWNKCPKCHKEDVFISSTLNLKKFDKMNKTCSSCGEKYEKEPGYFFGAMYVSYAFMVAWFVITWATNSLFFKADTWRYLAFVITTMILITPYVFRISRLLWLNFFTKYDPEICDKKIESKLN